MNNLEYWITPINMFIFFIYILLSIRHIRKQKKYKKENKDNILSLYKKIESLSENYNLYKNRAEQLEDAFEKGYGVPLRKEVTEVKADFNKLEMVIMLSGVNKLLNSSKYIEDSKAYISLSEKIQKLINKMKEEEAVVG